MDAVIRVSADEFNEALFNRIKSLINTVSDAEVTISINKDLKLNAAIENVERPSKASVSRSR